MFRKLFSRRSKNKDAVAKQRRQRLGRQRLGAERLEERVNFAALLAGLDIYGNLVIEDALPMMDTANAVTIELNGTNVDVTHNPIMLSGIGGSVAGNTVSIPITEITGKILVNTYGGNDTLTVDFTNGSPIPAGGLEYDGGTGTTDALAVIGNFTLVTSTYDSSTTSNAPQSGTLNLDGSVIKYKALEPITIGGTVTDYVFNLPGKGDLAELSGPAADTLELTSLAGTPRFETTTFATPTGSVTINLGADNATFVATASAETELGAADLIIDGQAGNDTINVSAFTATGVSIYGGIGADTIQGGAGGDSIWGGGGNDLINGNDGDDFIWGESDADTINGGNGADSLWGGLAGDVISGNAGADYIHGQEGNDRLNGNSGIDTIYGGLGSDRIEVLGAEGTTDVISGGNPIGDPVDATLDELFLLSTVELTGFDAPAVSIERITGNTFGINGTAADDVFNLTGVQPLGLAFVNGLGGADTITGTAFNDVLIGDAGDDSIDGGNGNDTITGDAGQDTLNGGLGSDVLTGGADDDTVNGGGGNDTIRVSGSDSENDVIQGGANTDTIVNMTPNTAVVLAGFDASTNGIERWTGAGGEIHGNGDANVLNFQISASATVVLTGVPAIRGLDGDDVITGTNAADVIYGGNGEDQIFGLAGNDTLYGEADDDTLNGGSGTDHLYGGDGEDTLTGGSNLDYFVFQNNAIDVTEEDIITDFNGDRIRYLGYGTNYANLVVSVPGGGPDTLVTDNVTGKVIRLQNLVKTKPQLPASLFLFV